MRHCWLICFLFSILAWGQGKPATVPPQKSPAAAVDADDDKPAPPAADAADVPADAAVLTIKGLCPEGSSKPDANSKSGCETVITRAQLEKVARAIQPSMTPVVKRQLVGLYPRLLIMSHEAEARGLDKEEYFQQMVAFARMQILTQQLTRRVQAEAGNVPDQEMADYYQRNPESFMEYSLERIYVPRLKQEPPPSEKLSETAEKDRQKSAESEMANLAKKLRQRAASGESFEALQKEAFESAGLKSNPPNANMGKIRRTGLPPGREAVFSLKAGEVSEVFSDSGGHNIYKLDGASMETLAEAKDEIHNILQSERLKEMMDKIQDRFTTEVNDAYFGTGPGAGSQGAVPGGNSGKSANSNSPQK
jgi:peptidyl-prolyl cis-trans isomerase C